MKNKVLSIYLRLGIIYDSFRCKEPPLNLILIRIIHYNSRNCISYIYLTNSGIYDFFYTSDKMYVNKLLIP